MAKELPYFRFISQEWQNGDISLEDYSVKGVFIDVCAYYWVKDCSITLAMLNKRFKDAKVYLKQLLEMEIIKVKENTDFLEISFLDEQFDILSEQRKRRQNAGSKGGKQKSSNAKAMLKQKSSYKDKDKYKDNDYKNTLLSELKNSDFDNPDYFEITVSFRDLFIMNLKKNGVSTVKIEKAKGVWVDSIRLLIENDKYKIQDLRDVFEFLKNNDFWSKNILSTSKLREKFDKLLLNARQDGNSKSKSKEACSGEELAFIISKHFAE